MEEPADRPLDVGDTDLHFERPRNDKGQFAPVPVEAADQLTPPPSQHPSYLVDRALDLGIDAEEMADLSTDKLHRLCHKLTTKQLKLREDLSRERLLVDPPRPAPVAALPSEETFDWGSSADGTPLDETHYAPSITRAVKEAAKTRKELAELRAELEKEKVSNQIRETRRNADILDAAFAKLGNERLFGKGGVDVVRKDNPDAFKRRVFILTSGGIDPTNVNPATIVSQLRKAAEFLTQASPPADEDNAYVTTPSVPNNGRGAPKSSKAVEEWNNGAVAKPTARKGAKETKGEALAVAKLTERMRESNLLSDQSDVEIDDTLFE